MQLDSQVQVREFNRRLRAALSSAPNHVRVEAALEVESHVKDVLSSHKSHLSESEQVAGILSAFGTPEEYAGAITAQLPGVQVLNVHTGVREVAIAASDFMRGLGRLLLALIRRFGAFLVTALHWLRIGAVWTLGKQRAHVLRLWLGRRVHDAVAASRGARTLGAALLRWLVSALRWTLRAAAYTTLGGLALAAFAVAGFTALAPDVVGFGVYRFQMNVNLFVTDVRSATVFHFDPNMQAQFTSTGNAMLVTILLFGFIMVGVIMLMVWNSRRRRGTAFHHSVTPLAIAGPPQPGASRANAAGVSD